MESSASNLRSINANTLAMPIEDLRSNHLIPVFIKDNEPVISQFEFIETLVDAVKRVYPEGQLLKPVIRVSQPLKAEYLMRRISRHRAPGV